jgi:hypothetical protein
MKNTGTASKGPAGLTFVQNWPENSVAVHNRGVLKSGAKAGMRMSGRSEADDHKFTLCNFWRSSNTICR